MCKAEPKFWFIPKYVLVLPKFCGINQNDLDKIKMLVCVKMNLNFGSYQNIFWSDPDCVVFYFENNFTACQSHITACQANIQAILFFSIFCYNLTLVKFWVESPMSTTYKKYAFFMLNLKIKYQVLKQGGQVRSLRWC